MREPRSAFSGFVHGKQRHAGPCRSAWHNPARRGQLAQQRRLAIGEARFDERPQVFQARLYAQAAQMLAPHALGNMPAAALDTRPRVVLTTLAGEPHGQTICALPSADGRVRLLLGGGGSTISQRSDAAIGPQTCRSRLPARAIAIAASDLLNRFSEGRVRLGDRSSTQQTATGSLGSGAPFHPWREQSVPRPDVVGFCRETGLGGQAAA